jgi:diadenosine tetraphosphatase ApaH/serine/threonine PP2A family protein phosphatase
VQKPQDKGKVYEVHQGDHHTLYREGEHISWDTDEQGNYVDRTGHTTDQRFPKGDPRRITDWSPLPPGPPFGR